MLKENSGRNVKIGLLQVDHVQEESREVKYGRLLRLAEACLKEGAELVFFPEAYQYTSERDIVEEPSVLRQAANAWKDRCSELARAYHAYIVPWDYEADAQGKVYNSSYILDREGREIGRYRKCHLTYEEQLKLTHGSEFKVFDLDFGKVGIMICFDNYFPESARVLGTLGAELVLYPLYGDTLNPQWETKLRARAMDNSMYIASSQIDMHALDKGICYSGLVDPKGNVLCRLAEKDSYQVVEIEMGKQVITNLNAGPGMQENLRYYLERSRNPQAYGPLVKVAEKKIPWEVIHNYSKSFVKQPCGCYGCD